VAAGIGVEETLLVAVGVMLVTEAIIFAQPSVHAIRARAPEPEAD
jgi:hypothetical protein